MCQFSVESLNSITGEIIKAAFEVSNNLGTGFLEKIYERDLLFELKDSGLKAISQVSIPVKYKDENIGNYMADILVEDNVLVELKCVKQLNNIHVAQCINYLAATNLRLCLLINFQKTKLEWKRIVG
jgi:GxxExxY protein